MSNDHPARIKQRLVGVYVHLPFCDVKCAYCDFFSIAQRHPLDETWKRYLAQLQLDLEEQAKRLREDVAWPVLASVFFGGGTPSKAPAYVIAGILEAIGSAFPEQVNRPEISAEANPESLTRAVLDAWVNAGINRVSVGMQSLDAGVLRYLGRVYRPEAYQRVLREIRLAGIDNFSADFITGVPGQTVSSTINDLAFALGEGAPHVSLYQLTIEPGTLLRSRIARGALPGTDDAQQVEQMEQAIDYLQSAGFRRYEVSNFSRPGFQCRHNLVYWTNRPYLGLGVSAHAFTGRRRFYYPRSLETYHAARGIPTEDTGTSRFDALINRLRLTKPFNPEQILRLFPAEKRGLALEILGRAIGTQWLARQGNLLRLTAKGIQQSDSLIAELWNAG